MKIKTIDCLTFHGTARHVEFTLACSACEAEIRDTSDRYCGKCGRKFEVEIPRTMDCKDAAMILNEEFIRRHEAERARAEQRPCQ